MSATAVGVASIRRTNRGGASGAPTVARLKGNGGEHPGRNARAGRLPASLHLEATRTRCLAPTLSAANRVVCLAIRSHHLSGCSRQMVSGPRGRRLHNGASSRSSAPVTKQSTAHPDGGTVRPSQPLVAPSGPEGQCPRTHGHVRSPTSPAGAAARRPLAAVTPRQTPATRRCCYHLRSRRQRGRRRARRGST